MSNFASFNTFSLSQDQEDLLMAALAQNQQQTPSALTPPSRDTFNFSNGSLNAPMFGASPEDAVVDTDFAAMTDQQFMHFLENGNMNDEDDDDDMNFEDSPDNGLDTSTHDLHDKRKSMIEMDKDDENAPKRREGEEKQAKKPGRKPLTSEPTSKRKAQNRAAQRAFRERKEKHLKDLETKVDELEKLSESKNHENSLLRAQVERQQVELREYKKRLSVQSTSNSFPGSFSMPTSTTTSLPNAFSFDFPQFSSLSYLPIDTSGQQPLFDMNMTASPSSTSRHASTDLLSGVTNIGQSPATSDLFKSVHGSVSEGSPVPAPPEIWGRRDYNIFSSPKSNGMPAPPSRTDSDNHRGIFQFNTTDSSSSPSLSSPSQGNGLSSSCETSPESTAHATTSIKEEQASLDKTEPTTNEDWTQQNGSFSNANLMPTGAENAPLWVDLPTNSLMGDGSFTGGFFNDIMPTSVDYTPMDWSDLIAGSSVKTGLTPAIQKSNPIDDLTIMPSIKENEIFSHPNEKLKDLSGCNKIWESIKQRAEIKGATDADIEGLCQELKKKAKCSETGPVIDQKDIDAALERRLSSISSPTRAASSNSS